jgi:hypothetical protein
MDDLHPSEQALGARDGINPAAYCQPPEREAEDEDREHQLERVCRGAEHEREHPDPADLVDERGKARQQRDRVEQPRRRLVVRGACRERRIPRRPRRHPDDRGEREVDRRRTAQRPRQADPLDQDEAARQHADGRAQAVGEIQHRNRFARCLWPCAHQAGAHERKRHAEQDRLRQDQQARHRDFAPSASHSEPSAGSRLAYDHSVIATKISWNPSARSPITAFYERVPRERIAQARRHAAEKHAAERHPAHEHDQHERLRVCGVTEEKLEVVRPDRLVDEPAKPEAVNSA